jgi:hypothetical protein
MGAVTSTVAARFAFFPPSPPSYGVELPPLPAAAAPAPASAAPELPGEEKGGGSVVVELKGVPRRANVEARRLRTKRGTEVVAMHVRQAGAKLTLLYSHGNAADLGQMYELFVELSAHLSVNLMGYAPAPLRLPPAVPLPRARVPPTELHWLRLRFDSVLPILAIPRCWESGTTVGSRCSLGSS